MTKLGCTHCSAFLKQQQPKNLSKFSLEGKVALVTGARQGLGLEIAKLLAEAGASVILNGRDLERLNQAIEVNNILSKLGVSDRTQAIIVAANRGIVS